MDPDPKCTVFYFLRFSKVLIFEKSLKIIETYKNKDITDRCWLRLSGRFLTDKTEESLSLLSQIITTMDFNDKEHFETLLKELKSYTKTNFIGNESSYLSVRGSSKLSVPCAIQELTHGITNYFRHLIEKPL